MKKSRNAAGIAAVFFLCTGLAACQRNEPPPDLIKTQRETLNKAKELDAQAREQAEAQSRAIEAATGGTESAGKEASR